MAEEFSATMDMVGKIATVVVMLIIVLLLAYLVSKLLSGQFMRAGTGKNIVILERVPVSRDTALIIARIGEGYFALSVTSHEIRLITELGEEEITLPQAADSGGWLQKLSRPKKADESKADDGKPFSLYLHNMRDMMENKKDEDGQE